jgi:hypothetical protein
METTAQTTPEGSYDLRIKTEPLVQKALNIEQHNRYAAANYKGRKVRKVDILSEWVKEKAESVIEKGVSI